MPIYTRQNQLDEAIQRMLDSEACGKIMPSPPAGVTMSSPTSGSSENQSGISSSGAKSPLSQAMLQIHSPSSVPDISAGETVVLQMEEGRATLIAHSDSKLNTEKIASTNTNVNKSTSSNSDSDDVFDHEKMDSKVFVESNKSQSSLQHVLSNLISSHVVSLSQEEAANKKDSGLKDGSESTVKSASDTCDSRELIASVMASYKAGAVSKGVNLSVANSMTSNGSISPVANGNKNPASRKSVEITVPNLSTVQSIVSPVVSSSQNAAISPGGASSHERKKSNRSTSKMPHPAFNIPVTSLEKIGSPLYNYNLPDRGLGSLMTSSPLPVTVSSPAVAVPRFPAAVTSQLPGQVLGFVSPQWPITLGHSPASNDSRSSGSPLDLSAVREPSPKLAKSKNVKEVPIKPHWVSEKLSVIQKQPVVNQVLPQVLVENIKSSGKSTVNNDADKESPPTTNASKVPYTKEMLYLFDKELEIISVGKNKWIIRNENELVNVVKRNSESDPATSSSGCNNCDLKSCSNGVNCANSEQTYNSNSPNGTEINKRPLDLEEISPRSKVTKIVNGDIHTKTDSVPVRGVVLASPVGVSSDESLQSGGDSAVTMET
ncbi:hypothetical protein ACF0H5_019368 [Mactra antiquata]